MQKSTLRKTNKQKIKSWPKTSWKTMCMELSLKSKKKMVFQSRWKKQKKLKLKPNLKKYKSE